MYILENVPLSAYSTMRLGGTAAYMTDVSSRQEVSEAVAWAYARGLPSMMIGDGSNIIWNDDGYPGLILVNKIDGFKVSGEYDTGTYITAGSGLNWDNFVAKTVEMGLTGLEFLSLVPGTVGATPVQNVGAYGAEVATTITTLEAYDKQSKTFVTLRGSECEFGYRTSRFKTTDRGRFFITAVTFFLQKGNPTPPFYGALQTYFNEHSVTDITPLVVRDAVIAIRTAKLPDPAVVANNGSFFANPIIESQDFTQLVADFPEVAHWNMEGNKVKISAAWLIEQAGFKDFHDPETGMGTWPKQPLVLVNEHAETTAQLLAFKQKIVDSVSQKFGISLVQEPELI
jgi:UDP-N-acetylmuramate dehydrogenase